MRRWSVRTLSLLMLLLGLLTTTPASDKKDDKPPRDRPDEPRPRRFRRDDASASCMDNEVPGGTPSPLPRTAGWSMPADSVTPTPTPKRSCSHSRLFRIASISKPIAATAILHSSRWASSNSTLRPSTCSSSLRCRAMKWTRGSKRSPSVSCCSTPAASIVKSHSIRCSSRSRSPTPPCRNPRLTPSKSFAT